MATIDWIVSRGARIHRRSGAEAGKQDGRPTRGGDIEDGALCCQPSDGEGRVRMLLPPAQSDVRESLLPHALLSNGRFEALLDECALVGLPVLPIHALARIGSLVSQAHAVG